MCGRIVVKALKKILRDHPGGRTIQDYVGEMIADRFNIGPKQLVVVVQDRDGELVPLERRWGLKAPTGKLNPNSRLETLEGNSGYLASFQRVLVPVSGFYEWPVLSGRKRPFFIHPEPPAEHWWMAGVCKTQEGELRMTILTRPPTPYMAEIHDRWPAILTSEAAGAWVDPHTKPRDALQLIQPWPDKLTEAYEVGSAVGSIASEGPDLIKPVA